MEYTIAALIPITAALAQAIKMAGLPGRFMPLASIGIGIGLAFLASMGMTFILTLLAGLGIGLAASGLYDVGKRTIANR